MPDAPTVFLNGSFLPIAEACVPVLDRGFLLGDGVYEVIPVYAGRIFRAREHLQRLQNSLDAIRITNPHPESGWLGYLNTLIERNGGGDQSIYLQITRGVAAKRDHAFPSDARPTVFMMSNALQPVDPEIHAQGIKVITLADIRWQRCDIKAITLLANVLLRQQAIEAGAAEAILVRDGYATEGAASNLFIVEQGVIRTPPKSAELLPGITRDLVLELAQAHGLPVREAKIPVSALTQADEIWISSSTKEIVPVTTLDQGTVGNGKPGPVWQKMHAIYQAYKAELRKARAAS